jgi:replicative DNA helicase
MNDRPPNDSPAGRPFDAAAYLAGVDAAGGTADGLSTGFPSLDNLLGGGFRQGDLIVLGGDTGCGCSSLAMAIALKAAADARETVLFSGEFSVPRLFERAVAMEGKVRIDDLRNGRLAEDARAGAGSAALRLRDRAPTFSPMAPNGISGLSDLLIEHYGLTLLVVDPVESLALGQQPLEEELATATRALKGLAVRRNCAVLLVAHLTAELRGRPDPRPRLEDFGAAGAVRQQADVVLGLFREELYDQSRAVEGAAEVHVLKNRNGALGYADLFFYRQWLRFEDMVER